MTQSKGRTRNFKHRISIEREALSFANEFADRACAKRLHGLSHAAINFWMDSLSQLLNEEDLRHIDRCLKELARATGLLADESRCAVAEGKVSSDFPELLIAFKQALLNAKTTKSMLNC